MSFGRNSRSQGGGTCLHDSRWSSFDRNGFNLSTRNMNMMDVNRNRNGGYHNNWSYNVPHEFFAKVVDQNYVSESNSYIPSHAPSFKRRKFGTGAWGDGRRYNPQQPDVHENAALSGYNNLVPPPLRSNAKASTSIGCKRDRADFEDDEPIFMSRDDIERYSPSRKDGIDALCETHLRYSYCAFLQNLGMHLDLPQTTIGTAMVLCHRFFVQRSHACHDRFLIATATLFLAAKSEETPRPLNNVLRASSEILHKQDVSFLSYVLPIDWFEQYRQRVIEAEQMILTTLNFELNVQHPYGPLTSVLDKLGLSQSVLVNLALNLVSEGVYTRLACWPV